MDVFYPLAVQQPIPSMHTGTYASGFSWRGVLHSTETTDYPTYASGSAPHFTVGERGVRQHAPINVSVTALEHRSGTVETNRALCVQIEIVGHAALQDFGSTTLLHLRNLMIWVEKQTSITPFAPVFKGYPASYGANNAVRFSENYWRSFGGWAGHQHVPGQDHGDPGALAMSFLLTRPAPPAHGILYGPAIDYGDNMKRQEIHFDLFNENGDGWFPTEIPFENVVNVLVQGPYPGRDDTRTWSNPYVEINNKDGKLVIVVEENLPRRALDFIVWTTS